MIHEVTPCEYSAEQKFWSCIHISCIQNLLMKRKFDLFNFLNISWAKESNEPTIEAYSCFRQCKIVSTCFTSKCIRPMLLEWTFYVFLQVLVEPSHVSTHFTFSMGFQIKCYMHGFLVGKRMQPSPKAGRTWKSYPYGMEGRDDKTLPTAGFSWKITLLTVIANP